MTELEWDSCTDPAPMLAFLRDRAGDRKLRLFACACCRHVRSYIRDEQSHHIIELVEGYADGFVSEEELQAAFAAYLPLSGQRVSKPFIMAVPRWWPLAMSLGPGATYQVVRLLRSLEFEVLVTANDTHAALRAPPGEEVRAARAAWEAAQSAASHERKLQCDFLRDVFGLLPFRSEMLDVSWLTSKAVDLAQAIYNERGFFCMPVLAEALEEAGCDNADILGHLRGPGPHVRGCWAIDRILGKE